MSIKETIISDNPSINSLNLNVSIENLLDIRVSSGTFKIAGQDYNLESDGLETIDVDSVYETEVFGYLAQNVSTEEIIVLVDEHILDGIDVPYKFGDGTYKLLETLFSINVPPGTTDLSTLELRITKILPTEEL